MLKIDFCSYQAAKYAVETWHYSKRMPVGKLVKFGVWEDEKYIGCVLYGYGANNNLVKEFAVKQTEMCELVRVALTNHETPVTRIVAITLKMLRKSNPGLKLVVSYADYTNQKHLGVIYQAGNWIYTGESVRTHGYHYLDGKLFHNRSIMKKYGKWKNIPKSYTIEVGPTLLKHRYVYVFDETMKKEFEKVRKPHPKNAVSDDAPTV